MWQSIKVYLFRKYYRHINNKNWQASYNEEPFSKLQLPTPDGSLEAHMYNGDSAGDKPLILYFHGGGWVIGDLETHQPFCQTLSQRTGCTVISVNYRLSPESIYPAAHDDALNTSRWVAQHLGQLGPSNGTLVIAGDSAGGNLAACASQEIDAPTREKVAGQLLIYPVTQHHKSYSRSYTEHAKGHTLTAALMVWFWDTYLGGDDVDETQAKRAMPMMSRSFEGLPPALVVTAEYDPLRDEGAGYAEKLRKAGVPTHYKHFDNAEHGFACSEGATEDFEAFITLTKAWLAGL